MQRSKISRGLRCVRAIAVISTAKAASTPRLNGTKPLEIQNHLLMAHAGLLGVPVRREIRALQPEHGCGSLNIALVKILRKIEPSRRPEISAHQHKADPRVGCAQRGGDINQPLRQIEGLLSLPVIEQGWFVERLLFGGVENTHSGHQ